MADPMLSVIVPTRNRAGLLAKALDSLTRQTLPAERFEVRVIDNGSSDHTRLTVEGAMNGPIDLHYHFAAAAGLHAARHAGMEHARGAILIYIDDDVEALPTFLRGIAESFADPDVELVGGKCLPKFAAPPPDWLLQLWRKDVHGGHYVGPLSIIDLGDQLREVSPTAVIGCNFSIRKAVLQGLGGFHPDAMPADLVRYRGDGESWVTRCLRSRGAKAVYNPQASVYHWIGRERMTPEYFARRSYLEGISHSYQHVRQNGGTDHMGDRWRLAWGNAKRTLKRALRMEPFPGAMEKTMQRAFAAGYAFHQKQVDADPALLRWVLQDHYLATGLGPQDNA
jgi:glycosyltransferase involved in cell wall biosynthesis